MAAVSVPAPTLVAMAKDGAHVPLRWLNMTPPTIVSTGSTGESGGGIRSGKFAVEVLENTNQWVRSVKYPLNLISIMGPARSGKSTLMNLLAGVTGEELFPTSPGVTTFTKGVYVTTRLLTLPEFSRLDGNPELQSNLAGAHTSFIDTEGQGSEGDTYDMDLFSPALVCSRTVIYTIPSFLLKTQILQQLGMMTQAAARLSTGSQAVDETARARRDSGKGFDQGEATATSPQGGKFGPLLVVFNRYPLGSLESENGKFSSEDYLTREMFRIEPEIDQESAGRNDIRKLINATFESVKVYILPDAAKLESIRAQQLKKKKFLLMEDFEDLYVEYFKKFRADISQTLASQRELIKGQPLTGSSTADFILKFAEAINKSEPLNIPSIFQAGQNDSINKALQTFTNSLNDSFNVLIKQEAKPTTQVSALFDVDVNTLMSAFTITLSYMTPEVLESAKSRASAVAQELKKRLLDVNLDSLKKQMVVMMQDTIQNIDKEIDAAFPNGLCIPKTEIDTKMDSLRAKLVSDLQRAGNALDANSLPSDLVTQVNTAFDGKRSTVFAKFNEAWATWATGYGYQLQKKLSDDLAVLNKYTKIGDFAKYNTSLKTILDECVLGFNKEIDLKYQATDKAVRKKTFSEEAEVISKTKQAQWQSNDEEIQRQLADIITSVEQKYTIQLESALKPHVEPGKYDDITASASYKAQIVTFLDNNQVSSTLSSGKLLAFDAFVSSKKTKFNADYTRACTEYRGYIQNEINGKLPLIVLAYNRALDAISLDVPTRLEVEVRCNNEMQKARASFDAMLGTLSSVPGGVCSPTIFATTRESFENSLEAGRKEKLNKFDDAVDVYNKALLAGLLVPVINDVLENKFPSSHALDTQVERTRTQFLSRKRGDGTNAQAHWNRFQKGTYEALKETIARMNAYVTTGLDSAKVQTRETQERVINNLKVVCANMANELGMSWINGGATFELQDLGTAAVDPRDPNKKRSHDWKLNNVTRIDDGYDLAHKTNLVFYDWDIEISDIIWGKPIITDIRPSSVDTYEYPAQEQPTTVTVGTSKTEESTITNSYQWNLGANLGYTYGEAALWGEVKTEFNASLGGGESNSAKTSFSTNTSVNLVLPANRVNLVHHMIFNQRTSLPYTARVRLVPKLKLNNGFVVWGTNWYRHAGADSRFGDQPNWHTDRVYGDRDFGKVDEIPIQARNDSGEWRWSKALKHGSNNLPGYMNHLNKEPWRYEVFVKGKWEGITGKYATTMITAKNTKVDLLPEP